MADKNDDVLQDLLDPKKLLEQLRECETKQFKNAIDLLQECEERHRRNEKKLSRLTIAASAGGALVGQEAVKEVGEITGIIEQVVSGDVSAITDVAEGAGFDAAALGLSVDDNGNIVLPGGFFGGAGGIGGNGVGNMGVNPEKATPTTEDEEDATDEDEEKGKEEEEEEAEEEEEEESEEEEEEQEEEKQEEQQEQEQEQEQQQDTPEPDPPSSDQSASIPSLPDNTEETKLMDFFEDVALTEMEQAIETIIQDTPDLLENLPLILRSRKPSSDEVIVGNYETNEQQVVIDETDEEEIVEEVIDIIEVPASPIDPYTPPYVPPIAGVPIPEPGVLGIFILAAWFCAGWSFRRRRKD